MNPVNDELDHSDQSDDGEINSCATEEIPRSECPCYKLYWPDVNNEISEEVIGFLSKLEKFYLIIKRICIYLPCHHLIMLQSLLEDKCSPEWMTAIREEILRRTEFNWLTVDYEMCRTCKLEKCGPKVYDPIRYSCNLFRTPSTNVLMFYDHDGNDLKQDVQFHKLQTEKTETKPFIDFLHDDLSMFTDRVNTNTTIVSCAVENIRFVEPFNKTDKFSPFCALYFPQIPHVTISQFAYGKENNNTLTDVISPGEKLECLLMFTTSQRPSTLIKTALKSLGLIQQMNITIAGGCVWEMTTQAKDNTRLSSGRSEMNCIAFKTSRNHESKFYSASIVIRESDDFETKLLQFKSNLEFRKEQILVRFCCFAKRNKDTENTILQRHFNCPIAQMDVNGEIGTNHYTNAHRTIVPDASPGKKRKVSFDYFHGYTTILVYISWGNLKLTGMNSTSN